MRVEKLLPIGLRLSEDEYYQYKRIETLSISGEEES